MFGFLIVLIVIAAILLIVIVLAQNPKGGGLAQGFSGGNQMLGVQGTNKFLTNTWILVGFIAFASVISASFYGSSSEKQQENSVTLEDVNRQANDAASTTSLPVGNQQQAPAAE